MPDDITSPASLPADERRLRSRLHQLLSRADGFLHGSLIEMARRCGNPRCRCASGDEHKHRSLYLGQTLEGKTTMLYVPKDLERDVRRWAEQFQQAADLLEGLSQQGRRRLDVAKARSKSNKNATKKKSATKKKRAAAKRAAPRKKTARKPPPRTS